MTTSTSTYFTLLTVLLMLSREALAFGCEKGTKAPAEIGYWKKSSGWKNDVANSTPAAQVRPSPSVISVPNIPLYDNPSHSIFVVCKLSNPHPEAREWILNLGQEGGGAHHWLYNPKGGDLPIQFGTWNGRQATKRLNKAAGEVVTLCSSYDASTQTYVLYLNGEQHEVVKGMVFNFMSNTLHIGHCIERPFSGEIYEVGVWASPLTAQQVAAMSSKGLEKYGSGAEIDAELKSNVNGFEEPGDVAVWSVKQVRSWVEALGSVYVSYGALFEFHEIDGKGLLGDLDDEALHDIGILNKLHRNRILRESSTLK